jgi:L,D-transpeptidase YcbB
MGILLLPGALFASIMVLADDRASPAVLQQVMAGDVKQSCSNLPALRSVDLHTALTELYQSNQFEALWQDPQRLAALKSELAQLADDGLEPGDYAIALRASTPVDHCAELRISSQYLLALEHLSRGRLAQEDHEPFWHSELLPPPSLPALSHLALTGVRDGITASFERARPSLPAYRNLRAAYIGMDRQAGDRPQVRLGEVLRPGMSDLRVATISSLLQAEGFLMPEATPAGPAYYDRTLESAVRRFQANQGLEADGIIGPLTVAALNKSPAQRVLQVQVNLERLRWINAQRSDYLLLVNVASGHLQLLRGDATIWQARAQSGRPSRPTPLLVSYINRITLNPSWTVPPTILREDVLPQIRRDPGYLNMHAMQVLDAQGNLRDPATVDWRNPRGIVIRQPPGATNPLGHVVFRLPNPYAIYLHDTPSKQLFEQANRNVSSGCVRVEAADELTHHLFAGLSDSQRERVAQQLASGQTHEISLANGPRVILAYWTAFADAQGRLAFAPDNYGLDKALGAALAGVRTQQPVEIAMNAEAGCAFLES